MAFQFECKEEGVFDFNWELHLSPLDIKIPFIFIGTYKNPRIMLCRSSVDFGKTIAGKKLTAKIKITNLEDFPQEFMIDKASCFSKSFLSSLNISPESGLILPNSSNELDVSYCHDQAINMNINALVHVKNKTAPLRLNVKAQISKIECLMILENEDKQRFTLKENEMNLFEIDQVWLFTIFKFSIGKTIVYTFYLTNKSNFLIEYKWNPKDEVENECFKIYPPSGTIGAYEETTNHLLLRSTEIVNGPSYKLGIILKSKIPGIHFSFLSYDFGLCYIHSCGNTIKDTELLLYNNEKTNISVRVLPTHDSSFDVQFESELINSDQEVKVPIYFRPNKSGKFSESLIFEINGVYKRTIELVGKAVDLKIEALNLCDKTLKFGAIQVGQVKKKNVMLLNKTCKPVKMKLSLITSRSTAFQRGILEVKPSEDIVMDAKTGKVNVSVLFCPKNRVSEFVDEV
ncbi:hydrocephalus-inducing protein-like [Octopus sinensis]|uniref:Hydrocephalus-inducing protein-like n=1 Tax=Octopus sinensis TaxID=2607531 RepID=A0A6P7U1J4_9MOLL|nr:hydrocephalus-inducing protein-like [Octopus sinensis]